MYMPALVCMCQSVLNLSMSEYISRILGVLFYSCPPTLENANKYLCCSKWNRVLSLPNVSCFLFFLEYLLWKKKRMQIEYRYKKIKFLIFLQSGTETSAILKLYDEKFWIMVCCIIMLVWKVCAYLCVYLKCMIFVETEYLVFWLRNCQASFLWLNKCLQNYWI